jgi:osmotically-inducible protein OsmY
VLWVEPETVVVAVRGGEVELAGELEISTDAAILEKLVEKIPGVVSVRSNARVAPRTPTEGVPRGSDS